MRVARMLQLVSLVLLAATPAEAQNCTALSPLRLAQNVAAVKAFPRPLSASQASELSRLLPVLRSSPGTAATPLRGWVATTGLMQSERCALVFALLRAVHTQSLPNATLSRMAGAAWPSGASTVMARIEALIAAITGLQTDLAQLNAALQAESQNLKALLASRPAAPGAQATPEAVAAFDKAFAEWQAKVAAAQQQIGGLQSSIAGKQAELAARQKELDALQGGLARVVDSAVAAAST